MNKNIRKPLRRPETQLKTRQVREEHSEVRRKFPECKIPSESSKSVRNRSSLVRPKQQDFSHLAEFDNILKYEKLPSPGKHLSLLSAKDGFDTLKQDSSFINTEFGSFVRNNFENNSQHNADLRVNTKNFIATSDGTQWQNLESINDLDKFMQEDAKSVPSPPVDYSIMSQNIHIAEVPKVKIIAEKFSKFQQGNVELRRLDEKVVCVEYDIFEQNSTTDIHKPVQVMRAFFSIKPIQDPNDTETPLKIIPSNIKNHFNIVEDDLNNLTQNGIEIIDNTIEENKSYLEDLRRVLKRVKNESAEKDRSTLDLKSLYEMAKHDTRFDDNNLSIANYLSIKQLKAVKDMILQQCASSVHGISRKTWKPDSKRGLGILSGSFWAELFNDNNKSMGTV